MYLKLATYYNKSTNVVHCCGPIWMYLSGTPILRFLLMHNLCLLHDTPEHLGEPWWNRDPLSVPSIPGHEAVPEYLDIREDLANLLQEQDN